MSASGQDQAEGSPCHGCGLCCDGTFLDRGSVVADKETMPLSFYKNEFAEYDGELCFKLPCPHYEGNGCPIYESRFATCRLYSCDLLRKFDKGEISLVEAQQTVAKAKSLVAAVADVDAGAGVKRERMRLRLELGESLPKAAPEEREGIARRILNIAMLDRFIELHFNAPKGKKAAAEKKPA